MQKVSYNLTITDMLSRGDGIEVRANDGRNDDPFRVGLAMSNPGLHRMTLGDKIRVTVEVLPDDDEDVRSPATPTTEGDDSDE